VRLGWPEPISRPLNVLGERKRETMLIKKLVDIPFSEVTPKLLYLNRRKFLKGVSLTH
jgi:hypothetical protein